MNKAKGSHALTGTQHQSTTNPPWICMLVLVLFHRIITLKVETH